jgi:hypothetical protein
MAMKGMFLGKNEINFSTAKVEGQFVEIANEKFYKISNYNQMPDFFMTIVSDSNHWMYLSSNGSLTAGRKNRDNALFPYYTVDKIHDYKDKTGSKTWCVVEKNGKAYWWEPFTDESEKVYAIGRNIYKSMYGNKIIFEEINYDLKIGFQYGWFNSEKFGWIKKSGITNLADSESTVQILDGIQNILPYGMDYLFQNEFSNLSDAYKKNELLPESSLGLFMLSSIPVDRAEPSEALKTTTVWSTHDFEDGKILISNNQVNHFKKGKAVETETDIRAARGAYYINSNFSLGASESKNWLFVAEINQDAVAVANLNKWLLTEKEIVKRIEEDIQRGTTKLKKIVAGADGLQLGNEELSYARHFSNTLFNVMRGGIFSDHYNVNSADFKRYLVQSNKKLKEQFESGLSQLPETIVYSELVNWAKQQGSSDLERISLEYLPLTFSRRHGDPSRPWNIFSIETKNPDGTDKLHYEGNWRDIFQNWEALGLSYPEFIEGMICKFLNASTADGYNPYRITRNGIDWESPSPDEPWANIGYWGDHQIIYLQKLLELSSAFHPGKTDEWLTKEIFVFAHVPYRIKSFEEIEANPKDTIEFDFELNEKLQKKAAQIGADGKLLENSNGEIYKVNLTEKLLVTLLAKLSNFIPEAGIWLNTQRPEWNDANNALVGNGVSMVTLYYIRRFLKFWHEKLSSVQVEKVEVSTEIKDFFEQVFALFAENTTLIQKGFSDDERYFFTSALGNAGSKYRNSVYQNSFSGQKAEIDLARINEFLALALNYVDQSIRKNKREDGLYHSYNLISINGGRISIRHLYEMLEGQVAVLSSGYLSVAEGLQVLDALKQSKLFREDQYSYILYPDRNLPRFVEKNNIPTDQLQKSELLQKLIKEGDKSVVAEDESGKFHFNGDFRNAGELKNALQLLEQKGFGKISEQEKNIVLEIYESVFDHQSFTGRSGTFFGYEGLGSIYWHMVSKLLLATQECYFKAISENADAETIGKLKDHYFEIKAGIGLYKSPELYGAFPTDAYSHTPANAGVKQPGLTGQVKEDVISRFGELGVAIENGSVSFSPSLLNANEILTEEATFGYFNPGGEYKLLELKPGQIGFTFCQVPVVYSFASQQKILVNYSNGNREEFPGYQLSPEISNRIFSRSKEIEQIHVFIKR